MFGWVDGIGWIGENNAYVFQKTRTKTSMAETVKQTLEIQVIIKLAKT